jgi:hypothetical protein
MPFIDLYVTGGDVDPGRIVWIYVISMENDAYHRIMQNNV